MAALTLKTFLEQFGLAQLFQRIAPARSSQPQEPTTPVYSLETNSNEQQRFNAAFDRFAQSIDFKTEAETILPENVSKAQSAFKNFCQEMNWMLAEQSFEELLNEKKGAKAYRKDGITPNWYHELRQILPILSMVRSGYIPLDILEGTKDKNSLKKYGGIEAFLCAALRHDSYEDFGKSPHEIFAKLEGRLHRLNEQGKISDEQLLKLRLQATWACEIIKSLSSKTKRLAEQHESETKDAGPSKITVSPETIQFYKGRINEYYAQTLQHYFSYALKVTDSIEAISTRRPPHGGKAMQFMGDDHEFARVKRALYQQIGMDTAARRNWSDMIKAIEALDAQLELSLNMLEQDNIYSDPQSKFDPFYGKPIRAERAEHSKKAYEHVPLGFQPTTIMLERLEDRAHAEMSQGVSRTALLLERTYYPSLIARGIIGPERKNSLLSIVEQPDHSFEIFLPNKGDYTI